RAREDVAAGARPSSRAGEADGPHLVLPAREEGVPAVLGEDLGAAADGVAVDVLEDEDELDVAAHLVVAVVFALGVGDVEGDEGVTGALADAEVGAAGLEGAVLGQAERGGGPGFHVGGGHRHLGGGHERPHRRGCCGHAADHRSRRASSKLHLCPFMPAMRWSHPRWWTRYGRTTARDTGPGR